MDLEYRRIRPACVCGKVPKSVFAVGLSTDHQLVIRWKCKFCKRDVHAVKPLADCWRDCPKSSAEPTRSEATTATTDDQTFLRSIGIIPSD
jgi:hypothetical protein